MVCCPVKGLLQTGRLLSRGNGADQKANAWLVRHWHAYCLAKGRIEGR